LEGGDKMSFIEVKHVSKSFKVVKREKGFKNALKSFFKREYITVDAARDINFSIEKGEIVGYIGPNGAGKSTTIKILSGILLPDQGSVRVGNLDPAKDRKKYVKNIGVVFGQRSQLWWDIPANDTFELLKDMYDIEESNYEKTKNELVKLLRLEKIINIPVRQLSLGERMRLEIAASLLHQPEILFLDEPTIGLDAISKKIVREFIKKLNQNFKTTVILTTHDMSDIEALAKRIILIGKGEILYDGTLQKLKNKYGNNKMVKIFTKDKVEVNKKGITDFSKKEYGYEFIIDVNELTISDFLKYISTRINIDDIEIDNANIDDIIVKTYEDYNI
jgi:ABC-2 type transport system ATP-binding protein